MSVDIGAGVSTSIVGGLDIAGYVDLVLSDADTQTLVTRALATARAGRLSDWIPREGQTETILLELLAQIVAELGYCLNQVPGYVVEVLLRLFGLTRDPGQSARTQVTFTTALSSTAVTIGAGALVVLVPGDGGLPVTFATTDTVTVAAGDRAVTVAAAATGVGAGVNGTPAGTPLTVLSAISYVDAAVLAAEVTGGTDPEDSAAFLTRGTPRLSRLVETLVAPAHFTAAALETPGVVRALTVDRFNADAGTAAGAPGTVLGHVSVAVAGAHGSHLAAGDLEDLRAGLQAAAFVLLTVHVVNADIITVDVAATVVAQAGFSAADVRQAATVALGAYLDPDSAAWGGIIYVNEVISLLDGVIGVDRVVSIDALRPTGAPGTPGAPVTDLHLTGVAPLPRVGTVTLTVTGGA